MVDFYEDKRVKNNPKKKLVRYDAVGSSLLKRPIPGISGQGKKTCSVDFGDWLVRLDTDSARDSVFLKMDVEGAEYELLEHLVRTQALKGREENRRL